MKATRFSRYVAPFLATLVAVFLVTAVTAQQAVTTRQANLRAGPDRGYPQVAYLPAGASVYVNGCLVGYRWCEVTSGPNRGWMGAKQLSYTYQNRPMTIYGNGAVLGLPIVAFVLGSYWNDYYRDRPWYRNNNYWNNWRPGQPQPPIVRPRPPRPPIQILPPRPTRPPIQIQPPRPPIQIQPPRPQPLPKPQIQPLPGQGSNMGPAPVRQ